MSVNEQKNYQIIENLTGKLSYVVASNRKAFMKASKLNKLESKILIASAIKAGSQ